MGKVVLIVSSILLGQLCSGQTAPLAPDEKNQLREIVLALSNSKPQSQIDRATLYKFVDLFCKYDCATGGSGITSSDHDQELLFAVFGRLADSTTIDTSLIRAFIKLSDCVRTNVELAEAMPCFLQTVVHSNVDGFLEMYQEMDSSSRNDVMDKLDWPCDTDMIKAFREYAHHARDATRRQLALSIADSLHEVK